MGEERFLITGSLGCIGAWVVRNLVQNALTHTPSDGTVTVSAEQAGHEIRVRVRDTGAGIEPQDLPHVFERFFRADRSRARASGGSGLGLAICKRIVEEAGGTIAVGPGCFESETASGPGATFTILLPTDHRDGAQKAA